MTSVDGSCNKPQCGQDGFKPCQQFEGGPYCKTGKDFDADGTLCVDDGCGGLEQGVCQDGGVLLPDFIHTLSSVFLASLGPYTPSLFFYTGLVYAIV